LVKGQRDNALPRTIRYAIERKRSEETRQRLTAILEATTDFVGTADVKGRSLYLNRAGRRLCGIPATEDLSGVPITVFHPPWANTLILEEGIPTTMRSGSWSGETALLRRDGKEIPVSQVILAHRSPWGEVEYLSTIIRDFSEYKRLQA